MSLSKPAQVLGLQGAGLMSEKLGRRRSLMVCGLLQIVISLAIHFSTSYLTLLVALTFSGALNSMVLNPSYAYLSEISLIRSDLDIIKF